jgi:hypothetical protein
MFINEAYLIFLMKLSYQLNKEPNFLMGMIIYMC